MQFDTLPKNKKLFIFDLDGTVTDTEPCHFEAYRRTVEAFCPGQCVTEEEFLRCYVGHPETEIYALLKEKKHTDFDDSAFFRHRIDELFKSLAVIQDMNIMRYIPMLPYEEEVRFYEKLDENVFLMKLIPGIRPKVLKSIFENYDCIIVESFGVGGIPQSIAEEFYRLCQEHPDKLVVMATQVAHEGSDMTVYEVGHNMKEYCRFLESYDMTLESVIAKVMWMLGNYDISSCDIEEVFYHSINYDLIFGKNRKCN